MVYKSNRPWCPRCGLSHLSIYQDSLTGHLQQVICHCLFCDGNLFVQRNFKFDNYSGYWTCIMLDILERFLQQINRHRSRINRITFNVVDSSHLTVVQWILFVPVTASSPLSNLGLAEKTCASHSPPYLGPIKGLEKYAHPNRGIRNKKIQDGYKEISTSEKRAKTSFRPFEHKFILGSWTIQIKISQQMEQKTKGGLPEVTTYPCKALTTPEEGPTVFSKPIDDQAALISFKQPPEQASTYIKCSMFIRTTCSTASTEASTRSTKGSKRRIATRRTGAQY